MTDPAPACYRDRHNGVRFQRQQHRPDCTDPNCRGCLPCAQRTHCTATKTCSWHIPEGTSTCGRCLARTRRDLRWIGDLAPLMLTAAMSGGVDSEAANLAGPAVDAEAWSWRKAAARSGLTWHVSLVEEDDEHHPLRVTQTWATTLASEYGQAPALGTVTECVAWLDRHLHRIAQDDEQDFPLLTRELRRCRQHLEAVLHNDDRPERGAPCPDCTNEDTGVGPRLVRLFAHWCTDPNCERLHSDNADRDVWQCPRIDTHSWSHGMYEAYVAERKSSA